MAHDESGSIPDSALSPATRAMASGATANPSPAQRASAYALQIGLQSDPPGGWAGNVWEQYAKYRGIVSLAIRPYVHAMRAAKINVLRRKTNVRKSLGGSGHYSRDDEYEPVEADHPLAQIVEEPGGPNGSWGMGDELAFLALQRQITGVGYAWCPPNTDGKPVRFFALATGSVSTGAPPGSPEYPQGSYIINPYMGWISSTSVVAPSTPVPAEQVPAFKEFSPYSRTMALSTLATGAKEIDLLDAITDFRWTYFNKGAALDTFIQLPGADDDTIARFKEQFRQEHVGSRNARKVLVAGGAIGEGAGAAKIQQLAPNAKDLDFPNGFEQSLGLVLAFFNVPKLLAGFGDTSNYATYHGELKRFYDIAITPFCRDLSAFLTKNLARAWSDYPGEYRIEVEPQLPADREWEKTELQFAATNGFVTYNQYLLATNRPPVEGGDVPKDIYMAMLQQKMQPQPQPAAPPGDPAAQGGTAAAPGAEGGAPPSEEQGAIPDAAQAPEGAEQVNGSQGPEPVPGGSDDDSEQGVQDATLQAALAALGMGGNDAAREDEGPVQKAAVPTNKPSGSRKPRAEGETWTAASGKRYTKKNGKIVEAPEPNAKQQQQPAQGEQPKAGTPAPPQELTGERAAAQRASIQQEADEFRQQSGKQPQPGGGQRELSEDGKYEIRREFDRAGTIKRLLTRAKNRRGLTRQSLERLTDGELKAAAAQAKLKHAEIVTAYDAQPGGTGAAPNELHGQILKTAGKSAKALGLTPEVLAKMHPDAVKTIAAQLGIAAPEQHYAPHAATVPASTPTAKSTLQRAHEWSDSMAQKHAAKVAQHLGVPPATAQKILAKAIRQIAEHALKNGGRASGTLTVGGKQLKVGVGKPGDASAQAAPKPAESGSSAAPSAGKAVHEMSAAESKAAGTKFFRTDGGSLYAVDAQGRTTRVKADHSNKGHDAKDVGLKDRSHKTVYVPSNIASALSTAGITGPDGKPPRSRVVLHDGKATLLTWNIKENRWGATASGRNVAASDKPAAGMSPLELWSPKDDIEGHEAYSGMHAGSAIKEFVDHDAGHSELTAAAQGKPGATKPAPLPGGTTAAPGAPKYRDWLGEDGEGQQLPLPPRLQAGTGSRPAGVPAKPPKPTAAPPRPEAQDRPGTAAGKPTPESPDWEQIANSPSRNRGTGLKRPGLLRRLKESKLGKLGSRAWEAYSDAVDRGIIALGNDEERADARERRADRRVKKAFDPWDVADELRDAGEWELAADLEDLLETDDLPTIRKAMADLPPGEPETAAEPVECCPKCGVPVSCRERRTNGNDHCAGCGCVYPSREAVKKTVAKADPAGMNTLSAPDGGFLVGECAKPKKKRRKVPVAELVRKAMGAPLPGDWSVPAPLPPKPLEPVPPQPLPNPVGAPPAPPMVVNLPADQPAPMVVNLPADPTPVTVNVEAAKVAPVPVTVVMPQTAPTFTNGTVERAEDGSWLIRREFAGVDGAAVAPTVIKARRTADGAWKVEQVADEKPAAAVPVTSE